MNCGGSRNNEAMGPLLESREVGENADFVGINNDFSLGMLILS